MAGWEAKDATCVAGRQTEATRARPANRQMKTPTHNGRAAKQNKSPAHDVQGF